MYDFCLVSQPIHFILLTFIVRSVFITFSMSSSLQVSPAARCVVTERSVFTDFCSERRCIPDMFSIASVLLNVRSEPIEDRRGSIESVCRDEIDATWMLLRCRLFRRDVREHCDGARGSASPPCFASDSGWGG